MKIYRFEWRSGPFHSKTQFHALDARDAWKQLRNHVGKCGRRIEYARLLEVQ